MKSNAGLELCSKHTFICPFLIVNPFPPAVPRWDGLHKISIYEGITNKISYDRHDYESVDEKNILGYVPKNYEKN